MAEADPFAPEAFKLPPQEVRRFLREKGIKPSFSWRDVWLDEHAFSFTVAKSTGYDILADVKGALERAIDERQDFEQFRAGLEPLLKAKGWWGKAEQIDPLTGEKKLVQLGSVRRLKTIYWANVESAYAAGEWERIYRTRRVLPYLEYLISTASHKRPEHLAQVGVVLPVDDPFWDYWYPPSDWGCQCRVRQLSEHEAKTRPQFGQAPEDFGSRDFTNKRTGEVKRVPNGVSPDWANNPGKARGRNLANFIAGKLDAMDEDMRRAASADLTGSSLFRLMVDGGFKFDAASTEPAMIARGDIALPAASLPKDMAKALGANAKTVRLSVRDATRIGAAGEQGLDYALVQRILDAGHVADGVITATIDGVTWTLALRVEKDGSAVYVDDLTKEK